MKATKSGYLIEEITTLGLSWRGVAMAPNLWRFIGDVLKVWCIQQNPYRKRRNTSWGGARNITENSIKTALAIKNGY